MTTFQTNPSEPIRILYILAASHSGSTLLAMLLGSHPDMCTVGELKATALGEAEYYRCSCRQPIKQCPFWEGIRQDMAQRGIAFDITNAGTDVRSGATPYVHRLLRPLHRGVLLETLRDAALALSPAWHREFPKIQSRNETLMSSILKRTGKRVLVDSSKVGIRLKYLLRNPHFDVQIVRLVRDGRGVALTYIDPARFADAQDPKLRGGGSGGDRESERLTMLAAAGEWLRSNEEADAILDSVDRSRWIQIQYEELCAQPDATLRRLFSFVGVDPECVTTDFRSIEHHVVGNGMRLDSTSEIRFDERCKTTLNASELKTFDGIAGGMNRRLGYK